MPDSGFLGVSRSGLALLVALAVDNVGSGLFLPLALVYATEVVGLPLGTAGAAVAAGTVAGLLVPALAGRLVDRVGARLVVIAAQVVQALGAFAYLAASSAALVVVAAMLLGVGQQLFYSSVFALIADVVGDGPKDRPYAVVAMVRSAAFGLGGLVVGGLLTAAGPVGYRVAVAADGVSFLACAVLLALAVRVPTAAPAPARSAGPAGVLADRRFVALIGIVGLFALSVDFFLVGLPVYVLDRLAGPAWLPGVLLALHTVTTSVTGTLALRATRRLARTTTMAIGAVFMVVWCGLCLAALAVPVGWVVGVLLAATLLSAAGSVLFGARANALAEAIAPPAHRGRYLAAFQYAFTGATVLAPAVVALFAVAVWLPWTVVAVGAAGAALAVRHVPTSTPPVVVASR